MTMNKDLLMERMTDNLPVLRKKLKLSQEALAQVIGSSRYTVMLMELRKRKMTWNTFLSLVLLFDKNPDTSILLRALGIYTDEFDSFIKLELKEQTLQEETRTSEEELFR